MAVVCSASPNTNPLIWLTQ